MTERPILFNGEMVRAVLSGCKTQTRRVMKVQPKDHDHKQYLEADWKNEPPKYYDQGGGFYCCSLCGEGTKWESPKGETIHKCPYGQMGDELWVRETFAIECNADMQDVYLEPTNPIGPVRNVIDGDIECFECPRYRASEPDTFLTNYGGDDEMKWKPSIHMPRWASRTQLKVMGVRVERVQDISEEDAVKEGIRKVSKDGELFKYCIYDHKDYSSTPWSDMPKCPVTVFKNLWDSIYAIPKPVKDRNKVITHYTSTPWEDVQETRQHKGKPWHVNGNPWVWAVDFERIVK